MKFAAALALMAAPLAAGRSDANPLGKVIQLMDDLTAKVTKEGEVEAKAFGEYMEWCDDASKNAKFAIEDSTKQKEKLEAQISGFSSDIEVATSKIEELASAISTAESDIKDATLVREKEAADFAASEKELMASVDALTRALSILEKEMSKNPAAFAQMDTSSATSTIQALSTILDAAALPASDRSTLQALLQTQGTDEDDAPGAPAAATYKTHSGGIFEVLEDLKEKAEGELSELRKAETNSKHNFEMLKQSLEDQKGQDTKDMESEKAGKAAAEEGKATASGELDMAKKTLATSSDELASTQGACMTTAADHDATVAARTEELKVIAQAKQILMDTSSGAVSQTYSFVQVASTLETRADLARSEVVAVIRKLAKKQHSAALAQLASRVAAVARYGASNGEDVFGKIKGLIQDMIEKLEREYQAEAQEKAYCDEQLAKTEAKKSELEDDIAKMTSKIDSAASRSAQLKAEVKVLQEELAALSKEQASMDKIRMETHEEYKVAKADLELGLTGVRKALTVLREYYGGAAAAAFMQQPAPPVQHSKASGAGQSIIGILEVVESDFAKNLAKEESEESDAESEYQKVTQENKITKATKEQDEKYKTQEAKSMDKTVSEYSSDREAANTEYSAVMDYYGKIKERCIAKPETYEERKARREAEIEGLKQALKILEEETALMQRGRRGGRRHHAFLAAQ